MEEFLFGAAYYPEYMPYDRLDKDIKMMKKAGMNTLRAAESTWSTLEPEEGRYDFSYLDGALNAAEQEGMSVIVGTPTYAVPPWLVKKEPDIMVEEKEGRAAYGHRQLMDIVNPSFRHYAERMIRKLAEHTAGHPAVIGYQIDNETKHYGNCGKYIQNLFISYLKEKFVTTEALNQAFYLNFWSNAIHRWEDFPDIRGCCNGGLASEFAIFQRKLAAEYLSWQAGIVSEYTRKNQFITHNFDFEWKKFGAEIAQDGYSYGMQPDINHYEASKALTIAGADIYHPTQDMLTGVETAFGGDEIRCLKQKNYLILETQAQGFKDWLPYPGQLRLHAYSHLASGAEGIFYWNWHSIHNGYEAYWKGILGHDLEENPVYHEICRIGKELKQIRGKVRELRKKNRTAVVIDTHSMDALKWFPVDKDLSYNDIVRWMYDSLYEMNIECDVVDVNALNPKDYQMIVTPALYSVSEKTVESLREFVRDGGVLVSSFRSFVSDRCLSIYPDRAPHGLTECFGMMYNQCTAPGRMTVDGSPVLYYAELLEPGKAEVLAFYEHRYWGRYAAAVKNRYQKGHAYYIGAYLEKKQLKNILRQAAADAKISVPGEQWPVVIRSGSAMEGKKLHFVLHYSEEERDILCPYESVKDILTGACYQKGDRIALGDWDVKILEEKPDSRELYLQGT